MNAEKIARVIKTELEKYKDKAVWQLPDNWCETVTNEIVSQLNGPVRKPRGGRKIDPNSKRQVWLRMKAERAAAKEA